MFSIEFWARLDRFTNSWPGVLAKGGSASPNGYLIWYSGDGRLWFKRNNDQLAVTPSGALVADRYRHFVLTYDGSAARWYIDGALVSTTAVSYPASSGTDALRLGTADQPGAQSLDEVAVYAKALTPARIAAHHQAATTPAESAALNFQADARHSGNAATAVSRTPVHKWTRVLGSYVSYPVITEGRVFVTVASEGGGGTSRVEALSLATGATLWTADIPRPVALPAATARRLFVSDYDGGLRAFDTATGATLWSTQLPGGSMRSPPVAANGHVYVYGYGSGGLGRIWAVDQRNGAIVWEFAADHLSGSSGAAAVTDDSVFIASVCLQTYRIDAHTGRQVWHHNTNCYGGGGYPTAVHDGKVFVRDSGGDAVMNAETGEILWRFESYYIPGFHGSVGYFVSNNGFVEARNVADGSMRWRTEGARFSGGPLISNDIVYVGTLDGEVAMIDAASGALLRRLAVGAPVASRDGVGPGILSGMNAAQGTLVVGATDRVVAFG